MAILIALLLPAVQKVRESAAQVQCASNLRQVITATHMFHDIHNMLPTYNGIFPPRGNNSQSANTRAVYGSWFVHIMPYVEQQNLWGQIASDVSLYTNTGNTVTAPGGTIITPGSPAVTTGGVWIPAVPAAYTLWEASGPKLEWVPQPTGTNGYTILTLQWVPAKTADPGTGIAAHWNPSPTVVTPAVPTVYGAPGPPVNGYVGIWKDEIRTSVFPVLQCPSDPSVATGRVAQGKVYTNTTKPWGLTNYLANWNALTNGNVTSGYLAGPRTMNSVTDGLSNTVFFGEGYAWCEDRGRTALLTWHNGSNGGFSAPTRNGVHNFGLTYSLNNAQLDPNSNGNGIPMAHANGFPNPSADPLAIMLFQIRPNPMAKGTAANPGEPQGCSSLTAQTGHHAMNIAMGDGSVRTVAEGMSPDTWLRLMLPTDGQPLGADW